MQYSILAIYKGLLYNKNALKNIENLVSKFNYNDVKEFRYNVPRCALDTKIGKYNAKDISKEILQTALNALKENGENEEKFLDPILELTPYGLSPADVILSNWQGNWNKDVSKLIKYLVSE